VSGHGYLMDPPGRNSMWRFGYNTPPDYDDDQVFCGGRSTFMANGYKCGVCGDAANAAVKDQEFPNGKYGKAPIQVVKTYTAGSQIGIGMHITTSHKGSMIFKICPATSTTSEVTQECLDSHVLAVQGGTNNKYTLPAEAVEGWRGNLTAKVTLPAGLKCDRCVIQWTWTAGNNYGKCDDGTSAVGCGPDQETFRNCADVKIQ